MEPLESIERTLSSVQLSKDKLNRLCSKKHRHEIATKIDRESLAEALFERGLVTESLESLSSDDLLDKWAEEKRGDATYFNLARAFHAKRRSDLIEALCNILRDPLPLDSNGG